MATNVYKYSGASSSSSTIYTVPTGKIAKVIFKPSLVFNNYTDSNNYARADSSSTRAILFVGSSMVFGAYYSNSIYYAMMAIAIKRNDAVGLNEGLMPVVSSSNSSYLTDGNAGPYVAYSYSKYILSAGETVNLDILGGYLKYSFIVIEEDV